MPIEVLMPALSPTMTKGKLIKWCVSVDDTVNIGDVIAEVETDKATMEVEAFDEGKIGKILIEEGTADVLVNNPIAVILLEGESIEDWQPSVVKEESVPVKEQPSADKSESSLAIQKKDERVKISPLASRIAKDNDLDISEIKVGSGPYGRIIKKDILELQNKKVDIISNESAEIDTKVMPSFSDVSTMRSVIAERLVASKQNIPHFYLTVECNLEDLIGLRKQVNENGNKITINDFIIKATGLSLKKFPEVNSAWQGKKIEHYQSVDVAVAVSLDEGLITPIVTAVDHKSLGIISSETKSLIKRAKENKLSPSEYQGGGITISNLGMFGIKDFVAIINPPQSSILAVGAAEKRPLIVDNEITIATMMTMTLSVDHRVIDGALAAQFLGEIKKFLENPLSILV